MRMRSSACALRLGRGGGELPSLSHLTCAFPIPALSSSQKYSSARGPSSSRTRPAAPATKKRGRTSGDRLAVGIRAASECLKSPVMPFLATAALPRLWLGSRRSSLICCVWSPVGLGDKSGLHRGAGVIRLR
ncbi:hypothetical protein T492DRAFT_22954 [Pavlovales sp. CCMP2436]|nr:hypothetical protein T492DRAFT_22954 [Pavlovales sp. CCMP2436]